MATTFMSKLSVSKIYLVLTKTSIWSELSSLIKLDPPVLSLKEIMPSLLKRTQYLLLEMVRFV